jgi:hypothetical protein
MKYTISRDKGVCTGSNIGREKEAFYALLDEDIKKPVRAVVVGCIKAQKSAVYAGMEVSIWAKVEAEDICISSTIGWDAGFSISCSRESVREASMKTAL